MIEPTFEFAAYGDWALLRVTGEIDMATAPKLRNQVVRIVGQAPAGLILDLDGVDFIDSTGLGVLVGAAKRMRVAESGFRIVCSREHLVELFSLTRLNEVFEVLDTVEDALAGLDGGFSGYQQ